MREAIQSNACERAKITIGVLISFSDVCEITRRLLPPFFHHHHHHHLFGMRAASGATAHDEIIKKKVQKRKSE